MVHGSKLTDEDCTKTSTPESEYFIKYLISSLILLILRVLKDVYTVTGSP